MALVNYFRAAPLPHLTSLKTVLLGVGIDAWLAETAVRPVLSAIASWIVLLCQADALCRYQEYRRLRALLARYGFRPRLLAPLLGSRCQRDAALLAARHTGHLEAARAVLRAKGYRSYHIIPDSIQRDPRTLLRPAFWRATFLPRRATASRQPRC